MIQGKLIRIGRVLGLPAVVLLAMATCAPVAFAEEGSPWWHLNSGSHPTYLPPGGEGVVVAWASNVGDGEVSAGGNPVTLTDTLPAGLTATSVEGSAGILGTRGSLKCSLTPVVCTFEGNLPPYQQLEVKIHVEVANGASSGGLNEVSVTGGGAPGVTASHPLTVSSSPAPFGVETYELSPEEVGGLPATQAGSHPFQLTTTLLLNGGAEESAGGSQKKVVQPAMPKDLKFALPPGLVGNPTQFPRCSDLQFGDLFNFGNACPANTALGVVNVTLFVPGLGYLTFPTPVFNLVPAAGEPARFGFIALIVPVVLDTSVRTGGDYGVTVSVDNISQGAKLYASQLTFWGVPGDARHDISRGKQCAGIVCETGVGTGVSAPFLSLPTSCGDPLSEPLGSSVSADSWSAPSVAQRTEYAWHDGGGAPLALDGCNRLGFDPSISVTPDGPNASTPTGLTVGVHVPQETILSPTGTAESALRDTTVTLPAGVQLSPAAADGLGSCSVGQIGVESAAAPVCPEASKIGTVELTTPLLSNTLEGAVYLAAQGANPFGSLVAMYIVVEDRKDGILVKIPGEVVLDQQTGQVTAVFKNTPELPFEDLRLHFFGSARAPLTTPPLCGSYTTQASFAPWSGNPPAEPSSTFQITAGPHGSPCSNPLPFAPELTAGGTNVQAGAFTPFTTTFSRSDGNQNLQGIVLHMPSGLSGLLTGVKLCGEAEGNAGTCGPESEIGETTVSVGMGGSPFSVKGGRVYITGPYGGAPFGLSIVNPAKAGPYDLEKNTACDCVVVRAKIEVDPVTAALTIATDDTGPYKIPTILDGIPLEIQHVNVLITRPGFAFNPTNCDPTAIAGSLLSTQGVSKALSVPFQVTNCVILGFKPQFAVSTSGKTSRSNGASLHVKLAYPKAPFGSQANIAKVKVDLPKQLPSRLTTLQKACPAQTFAANPASCPSASVVGHAIVHTQLLPVALEGPAYFVSHGGEAFPNLIIVLQGDGVTIDLVGDTFIKNGVTSSTFAATPDVPFESFELTLPEGPYSALAANGDLCRQKLVMPTAFTAQNGVALKQATRVEPTGCPRALSVLSKRVNKRSVKIGVYVPAAGRLTISGRGVSSAGRSATGPEALSLTLNQQGPGKLTTRLKVAFTPSKGRKQTRTVTVRLNG